MRILLPTLGSSGDVHPVIGIGRGLRARGHHVTVVTNEIFSDQILRNGLEFIPMGTRAEAEELMSDPRLWQATRGFPCVVEGVLLPNIRRLYDIIAAHREPSTVVAATTLCLGARVAQETLGIPTASIHLQPTVFRSLVDYGRLAYLDIGPAMPSAVKRLLFWIADRAVVDRLIAPALNAFRAGFGLAPVDGVFRSYIHSPQLVLGLFPDWFAAPQADWPVNSHLTGFILHDEERSPVPAEAERFLAGGPAPLLVTPGSAAKDRTAFFRNAVEACSRLGLRAMLVTNHPDQLPPRLPPGIEAFPYIPFSRILPRCAAIAYHGGIGTLSQAVKAGVPHLVIPNAHDQPDNGQRIERLGLGFTMAPWRFGPPRAERALRELVNSAKIKGRCREYAPRIDGTGSLERACTLIEQLGNSPTAPLPDRTGQRERGAL